MAVDTIGTIPRARCKAATAIELKAKTRVRVHRQKFAGEAPGSLGIATSPAFVDLQIAARLPAQLFEPLVERHQPTFGLRIVRDAHQNANALHSLELLRPRRERPRGGSAAEQRDERAPRPHSITSSARARRVAGTSRPSVLAVLRLMTSSNLVGCWTGMSAGFARQSRVLRSGSDGRYPRDPHAPGTRDRYPPYPEFPPCAP